MNKKELWKLFLLFLEMNECKGSYLYYARKQGRYVWRGSEFCDETFLWDGFDWSGTRQGHRYWMSLADKWDKVLRELRDAGHID